ncbi:MAG: hypothetical protein H0V09_11540 [Gemmatimonadetes bacterium]|nr:hypothetical protein [Gemmatimonadota bacterium]
MIARVVPPGVLLLTASWGVWSGTVHAQGAPRADAMVAVPSTATPADPVPYPGRLEAGERLLLDVDGSVRGFEPDSGGAIPGGALVASFDGGPVFLVGTGRLLWTAPAAGRLSFAVLPRLEGELAGDYRVQVTELGRRGDSRGRRFPPPAVEFRERAAGGPLLELSYADRAGTGLDRKTLKVFADGQDGRRVVVSPYFTPGARGAKLESLPRGIELPRGIIRVTATISDGLGNVSAPAIVLLDRP